jgi:hypothetical protein
MPDRPTRRPIPLPPSLTSRLDLGQSIALPTARASIAISAGCLCGEAVLLAGRWWIIRDSLEGEDRQKQERELAALPHVGTVENAHLVRGLGYFHGGRVSYSRWPGVPCFVCGDQVRIIVDEPHNPQGS